MPDVIDILNNLPQNAAHPDADTVTADVARGHQAATRRRQKRIGFAAVVAVGAGQLGTPAPTRPTATGGAGVGTQAVRLVSYTGGQPDGFTVTTVPDGWTVISSTAYDFVVAPPGKETGGGPSAGPSTGPAPVFYDDRIAVYLQGDDGPPKLLNQPPVQTVDINGNKGKLGSAPKTPGETTPSHILLYPSGKHTVVVQVPASTGLTDDQIVSFARGITVTGS